MAYYGRARRIREERAEARFEPPVWRTYVHEHHVLVAMIREAIPEATEIILPDERSN